MRDSAQPTPGKLAVLRELLNGQLDSFQSTTGVSADAYWPEPIFHPMAAGKYISSLVELHHAGLLSTPALAQRATPIVHALVTSAVVPPSGVRGRSWGLGHPWRDLPADEPYLITTAIVTRAMAALSELLPNDSPCSQLREQGTIALIDWCQRWRATATDEPALSLPAYSNGIRRPVFNAAAMGWSTLLDFVPEQRAAAIEELRIIWACRVRGLGWRYEPGSAVIDLVHQAYLFGSMHGAVSTPVIAQEAESSIGQFAGGVDWTDVMHLVDEQEGSLQRRQLWIRLHPPLRIAVDQRRARLWSLGELLVLVCRFAGHLPSEKVWLQRATAIAESVANRLAESEGEAKYARHTMHASHGLAAYLRLRRNSASDSRRA